MICQRSRMKKAAILMLGLVAAFSAAAAGEKKEGEGAKKGKPGTNVDMPYLMAPLTNCRRQADRLCLCLFASDGGV